MYRIKGKGPKNRAKMVSAEKQLKDYIKKTIDVLYRGTKI